MFKDSVITGKQKTREIIIFLACFVVAFGMNVHAIIKYATPWTELFSQIGFVCLITGVLYVLLWVIRIIALVVRKLIGK